MVKRRFHGFMGLDQRRALGIARVGPWRDSSVKWVTRNSTRISKLGFHHGLFFSNRLADSVAPFP